MTAPRPIHCRPEAFGLFAAQLPRIESRAGLLWAAVAIAKHADPAADPDAVDARLRQLADRVRARVRGGGHEALLAHAHAVLFDEERLRGNAGDYFDPRNSFLPHVLATRRGIPITLALVYVDVLQRLGIPALGVNSPGHFLARVEVGGQETFVDAFSGGRAHTRAEALAWLATVTGAPVDPDHALAVATHHHWLYRMLQNLKGVYGRAGETADHAAMVELEELLFAGGTQR
jgi:regulator of sirC expression with transglutaminase-like and TPR domain